MNRITHTVAALALLTALAGCSSTRTCPTGQTAVGLNEAGELTYTPVMGPCAPLTSPGFNNTGIFAEGPLPPPAPGMGWY